MCERQNPPSSHVCLSNIHVVSKDVQDAGVTYAGLIVLDDWLSFSHDRHFFLFDDAALPDFLLYDCVFSVLCDLHELLRHL